MAYRLITKIKDHKILLNSLLLFILCMCSISTTSCRPSSSNNYDHPPRVNAYTDPAERAERELYENISDEEYESIKKCNANLTLMELCMRCSKVTKVRLVYPSCCADTDNIQGWCREYIYYGIIRPYDTS